MTDKTGNLNSQLDWVASYPKCGNTWMRLLLASYKHSQLLHYHDVSMYMFQCVSPHPVDQLTLVQQVQLRNAAVLHIACACAANVAAIVKTHHANVDIMGMQMFAPAFVRKAIYIIRDPRDAVMSMCHHFDIEPQDAIDLMNNPLGMIRPTDNNMAYILGTWSEHVTSWAIRKADFPVHVTTYEKMHADTAGELRKVVKFLEWPLDDKEIQRSVAENEFSVVQAEEAKHGFSEQAEEGRPFFRRGQVGSWREELAPEFVEQVEQHHRKVMETMGYKTSRKLKIAR